MNLDPFPLFKIESENAELPRIHLHRKWGKDEKLWTLTIGEFKSLRKVINEFDLKGFASFNGLASFVSD